jgi:hypothetical protein
MTQIDDLDFTGGYGGEAAEAGAAKGASFNRTEYFRLDGSPAGVAAGANVGIIRFLSDHVPSESNSIPWITVDMHSMVPTRPKPQDYPEGRTWPRTMSAVCRKDKIFRARYNNECYIHTLKKGDGKPYTAAGTTWALAVVREEVLGTKEMAAAGQIPEAMVGQVVGIRDKMKEIVKTDEKGEPIQGESVFVPEIVIVQQKWKNFWSIVQGFASRYKTVLDRDYHITRKGDDTSTTYQVVPLDPIQMADGTVYDLRRPDLMKEKYPELPDLRMPIAEQASDEYYAKFFDITKPQPSFKKADDASGSGPATPTPTGNEPSTEQLNALASRLTSYQPDGGQAAPPAQPQGDAAAAPPAGATAPAGGMMNFS